MKYNLDFTIYSSEDRCKYIKSQNLQNLSKKEIEAISNYILFGKDSNDNKSIVDKGLTKIETKFNYKKNTPVSLEALLESPTFNENIFIKEKYIYKKYKPEINKDKAKEIRGMEDLWKDINYLQNIYDQNIGKKELEEKTPVLSPKGLYYLKHELRELKQKQYPLMDSVYPTLPHPQNKAWFYPTISESHLNYNIYPRGLMKGEKDLEFIYPRKFRKEIKEESLEKKKYYLDFTNPNHIYQLILNYWDLKLQVEKIPDSLIHNLLWTLDFYIEKANLSDQQKLIINDKKFRLSNKAISKHLEEELGITHQENYISTIWNKCCSLIAAAADLNYDEFLCRNYDKAWKVCSYCGQELLRDPRNFVRKTKALDGLTGCCKKCDKIKRGGLNLNQDGRKIN